MRFFQPIDLNCEKKDGTLSNNVNQNHLKHRGKGIERRTSHVHFQYNCWHNFNSPLYFLLLSLTNKSMLTPSNQFSIILCNLRNKQEKHFIPLTFQQELWRSSLVFVVLFHFLFLFCLMEAIIKHFLLGASMLFIRIK